MHQAITYGLLRQGWAPAVEAPRRNEAIVRVGSGEQELTSEF
jgi:hypothetical protein